jgi:SAM-dependent methyltransferase
VGESERNLREALKRVERMAPCVLWIDEVEKAFAASKSSESDGGVSRRLLGALLTWMQEHSRRVFLAATCNSVDELPPELMRAYFEDAGEEQRVTDRVRRRVQVRPHDLSRDGPPRADYDLILCRNVVIYFDRPMQERLFAAFADALLPGGYLVLGKVETLFGVARDRLALVDPRERVYRRPA